MLTDAEKKTIAWIKEHKPLASLKETLTIEDYNKLFFHYPKFLIWLWGEEWYLATRNKED